MLKTITRKFKPFFVEIKKSRLHLIKSSGLIPIYNFILKSPLKDIIDEEFFDKQNQKLINYLVSEFILLMLLKLFTNVFATNMALTSENIYGLYREHAQVETIIGELKSGFGTVKSHCQKFDVNQSLTQLCGIAYNIKTLYASQILKYDERIPDIGTIRDEKLHIPGYFANYSGKKIFNVVSSSFKRFNTIFSRVNNFYNIESV